MHVSPIFQKLSAEEGKHVRRIMYFLRRKYKQRRHLRRLRNNPEKNGLPTNVGRCYIDAIMRIEPSPSNEQYSARRLLAARVHGGFGRCSVPTRRADFKQEMRQHHVRSTPIGRSWKSQGSRLAAAIARAADNREVWDFPAQPASAVWCNGNCRILYLSKRGLLSNHRPSGEANRAFRFNHEVASHEEERRVEAAEAAERRKRR